MALGYVLGFVPGPIVAAVGGLALATFGRGLELGRWDEARAGLALAVLAGAAGVAALRWGTLELGDIRGAQAVLGPTVLVESVAVAAACGAALGAGVVALGFWISPPTGVTEGVSLRRAFEAATGALLLVSVFSGPAVSGEDFASRLQPALIWVAGTIVLGGLAFVIARFAQRFSLKIQFGVLVVCVVVVGVAAAVVSSSL